MLNLVSEMEKMKKENEDLLMEAQRSEEHTAKRIAEINERNRRMREQLNNGFGSNPELMRRLFS